MQKLSNQLVLDESFPNELTLGVASNAKTKPTKGLLKQILWCIRE